MGAIDGVSVIITAYCAEGSVARAVRSALDQRGVREVIVIDDASPDSTAAAARGADDGSGRLRVIRLDRNAGPAAARNLGVAAGRAPFIAILDADDYLRPDRFAAMPDRDWDLIADDIAFVPEGSAPPTLTAPATGRLRALDFVEFVGRNISRRGAPRSELGFLKPVIRRAALDRLGLRYDESLRLGEDFILYATALARGARFMLTQHCGYVAEVRAGSLSGRHRTEDLAALVQADRQLRDELSRTGAPAARRAILRRHLAALEQKVATRRYLDDKRRVGLTRATLSLARRPDRLIGAAIELLDGIAQRRRSTPLPPVRMLFEATEFDSVADPG